ncbi:MAG: helix-turn-helix domain-containing protein [Pseudonocardia sp.]|nr:helix-turn-helix domain-containing protein [Pseudonocardia sp.]MBO0874776.1 helix-turn-helix domain-containing protein [Pseudonocardia sp.]
MGVRSDPSAMRWLIGHELRRVRLAARRTQAEAGRVLGCTPVKINHLESGRNKQPPDDVVALMRFYGADAADLDRLASLAGRADQGTWWAPFGDVLPNWFKTFVGLEGLARAAFVYVTMTLPGQMQIKDYATAIMEDNLRASRAEVGQVVRARLARQRLTDEAHPLDYHTVVEEGVLHRVVGGPTVMKAQLERLLQLVELDNVTLQIMPTAVAVHDGLDGPFQLLDFAEAQSIGYLEHRSGAVYVQDQDEVEVYNLAAERLAARALSDADSADLIRARIAAMT